MYSAIFNNSCLAPILQGKAMKVKNSLKPPKDITYKQTHKYYLPELCIYTKSNDVENPKNKRKD